MIALLEASIAVAAAAAFPVNAGAVAALAPLYSKPVCNTASQFFVEPAKICVDHKFLTKLYISVVFPAQVNKLCSA
ncbi:hypothetical protein D3C81_946960 [compost metagenome]